MTNENEVILQLCAISPAPLRDYHGLTVTESQVILNTWNISHGPHVYPRRQKCTLEDLPYDKYLQNDIRRIFGSHALNFCLHLTANDRNLQYLPTKLFLRVLRYLGAQDILSLSQTSKIFFELCNTDAVWKIIYRKKLDRPISFIEHKSAENIGWKKTLINKVTTRININNLLSKKTSIDVINEKNSPARKAILQKQNNVDIFSKTNVGSALKSTQNSKNLRMSSANELSIVNNFTRIGSARDVTKNINQTNDKKAMTVSRASLVHQSNNNELRYKNAVRQNHVKLSNSSLQSRSKTLNISLTGDTIMNSINNIPSTQKMPAKSILKNSTKRK